MKLELSRHIPVDIYATAIAPDDRLTRKEREERALKALLAEAFGADCKREHDAGGVPVAVAGGRLVERNISISHSMHYAVLAVAAPGYETGIDIEERREQLARVCPRVLSDEEMAAYGKGPDGMLEAWTLKEALYKAWRRHSEREIDFSRELHLPLDGKVSASTSGAEYHAVSEAVEFGSAYALLSVVFRVL